MSKKKSKLQQAQDEAQAAINETNKKIEELGKHSNNLCIELNNIQKLFDEIRNIPSEKKIECEKLKKIRLNWKQQAEKIDAEKYLLHAQPTSLSRASSEPPGK